jgi:hypothetical protein
VRQIATTLALALCLLGCSSTAAPTDEPLPAPSGKPIEVARYGSLSDTGCPDQVEGPLRADVSVERYVWGTYNGIVIEVSPDEAGVWPEPSGVDPWPVPLVPVRWPTDYTGVRLADGEVAVVNTGYLVAMTGMQYRLKGEWAILGSTGGPKFPHSWIHGFNVCPDSGSVVPQ